MRQSRRVSGDGVVDLIYKLPGIGKKTALRLVLHLLKQEKEDVQLFSDTIERMRREIKFCSNCFNISDGDLCAICLNPGRKKEVICVVENIRDVIAIESTEQYHGSYHVLGGVISPLDGIGPDQLKIESLVTRVQQEGTGISFGGELEYADEMTLAKSIRNRLPVDSYIQ